MTYPIYIFPTDQPTEIWAHNGCIFAVSNGQVEVLCRPQCSPSGCTMPARQFSIQSAEAPAAAPVSTHPASAAPVVPAPPVHTPVPEPQLPPIPTIAVIETPEASSTDEISVVG